ncbi:uncharacterized protein LOC121526224 isoform X2 [Cheilinus undulatus]|uniref:uncharacterized protein LOC121526224 isoform X2 n=1 Tax=Cheilinus undulatus TaxID=241271 RepID=UPI001BD23343|nr:uncharacterized protein LOC121526224 isoform X2 [Cheilinus undulatus]
MTFADQSERHTPSNMDQLAFKYMDMCKVESSTDSESEISPRWSDTSTMGCSSSAPESRSFRRMLPLNQKPAARPGCYSLFFDPYDGSSEDSDESNVEGGVSSRRTKQQGRVGGGGGRVFCKSRRFILHHPASDALREVVKNGMRNPVVEQQHVFDIQMKCGSDSELWVCELDINKNGCRDLKDDMTSDSFMPTQTMDVELHSQFGDSGLHASTSCTPPTPGPVIPVDRSLSQMLVSSSERSPSPHDIRSLHKRKLGFPGAEVVELGQRKRQCVFNMEDSASEPC